ncbi:GNAT family N-acetyltransferase [Nonomuraea africana]|uniref:GNAT superfamily N-acetyltransferase n=1 Tax=Nonomuraea africana TaxID=46171 RepID=A0ABR9KCL5_9ACTN|nr:GNAT family N-acetyltransferase [Nonomuraea africana]MBE1559763.1 GNAT superfamily N-acetyltransferase [Nonomuraea africana]
MDPRDSIPHAPDPDSADQTQQDLLFAWSSAINIPLEEAIPAEPGAVHEALQAKDELLQAHVDLLLTHVRADPDRLRAIGEAARQSVNELGSADPGRVLYYLVTAELAERALSRVQAAGAEQDQQVQRRLVDEIEAAWYPAPEPFRPGLLDRHRLPRRIARRLNLRWWFLRWRLQTVTLTHRPADGPADIAVITATWRGQQLGKIGYMACDVCRQALVCKVSVDERYQNLGLGRRLVLAARAAAPAHEWTTTPQYDTAERFWRRMARTTGDSYRDDVHTADTRCPHMNPPRPHLEPI